MKKLLLILALCACLATTALGDELGISSVTPNGLVNENLNQISIYFTHPMRRSLLGSQGPPRLAEGELGISHFSPSGEIGIRMNNITIHFTHAMIPLGDIKKVEATNLGMQIEPPIPGSARWYGTDTWTFTPADSLKPSTTYRVTIPAGIRSVDGKEMRNAFAFEFETSPVLATNPGIKIEPPLVGRFLWRGEQGITFEIAQKLQQATLYRVTIPAGLRSFAGKILPKDYTFDIMTSPPYVSSCNPWNECVDVVLESDIYLDFTQPVNAREVSKYITLSSSPASSPDSLTLLKTLSNEEKSTNRIHLKPLQPFAKESWIWVNVRDGWSGLQGLLPCDRIFTSRFKTYGPLRYQTFGCLYKEHSSSAPGDTVVLHFNNCLVPADFRRYVSIAPAPSDLQAAYAYDRRIFLPSSLFQFGRHHTITFAPGLTDVFGQQLGQSASEKIYMFDLNPTVAIEPNGGRVLASSARFVRISMLNVPKLYLECHRADPTRVFSPQVAIRNEEDLYNLSAKQYQKTIEPDAAKNETWEELWSFDSMTKGKPGIFFLRTRTDNLRFHYEKYETIVREARFVISDLGITARYGTDNILIFVSSMQEGTPVADARVIIRNKDDGIVWQGVTDLQGVAMAPGKRNLPAMGIEPKIYVCKGEDMNYLELNGGNRDGWISGYSHYHEGIPSYATLVPYIYTDRGVYRPGHTVHLTGIFRKQDEVSVKRLQAAGQQINITVQDARKKNIFSKVETISDFDTFSVDVPIPENGPLGIYCASIDVPGKGSASKDFDVQEYRVSDFEASVQADKTYFLDNQPVSVTISSKYLTGAPLTEAQVKWSLQVISYQPPTPSKTGYLVGTPSFRTSAYAAGQTTASLDAKGELKIQLYPMPVDGMDEEEIIEEARPVHVDKMYEEELAEPPQLPVKRPQPRPHRILSRPKQKRVPPAPAQDQQQNPQGIFFNGGPGVYQIVAEVTAANRQVVNTTGEFTVYPSDAYVGLRLTQKAIKQGGAMPVSVLAFSPDGQPVAGLPMTLKTVHVLKQEDEYKLWAENQASLVSSVEPVSCGILLPVLGDYQITVQLKRANVSDTARVVAETDQADSGQPLEIVPDKEEYLPGQTARLMIRSPYQKANGVLCIERSDLVSYLPLSNVGASHTVPCEIKENLVPNATVYLFLVKGAKDSGEKNIPEFRSGRCELKVSRINKRLDISLKTNGGQYAPQDKVELDIAVQDSQKQPVKAHMAVMVVDEGVLTLTGFKTPDPLFAFICPRASWMVTQEYSWQHVRLFSPDPARKPLQKPKPEYTSDDPQQLFRDRGWEIQEYKPEPEPPAMPTAARFYAADVERCEENESKSATKAKSAPMPAAEEDQAVSGIKRDSSQAQQIAQRMSNIRIRKVFATTTYFNPAVLTDESGKARVSFQLPENLTSFRIMAVAVDHDERFGSADTRIIVKKPVTLKVSLPRFAHVGDTFRAGVVVINQSGQDGEVICSLKADGITILGDNIKKARLAEGASLEIPYELKAARPGVATFTFAAFLGKHQDGVVEKIPIKYPATTETFGTYGVVSKQPRQEAVLPPDKIWPGIGGMDVTFASTAMTNLQDGIEYLLTYPYGCIEQTSSRLFPLIGLHEMILEFKVQGLDDAEIRRRIAIGVDRICSMQTAAGGFGYWPGSSYDNPWASAYALFLLLQVRDAGHPVSSEVLDRAANYLLQYTSQGGGDVYGLSSNTLALVSLAMAGRPNTQAMERLYENTKTLPIFAKAFLAYAYTLAKEDSRWKSRTLLQQILNQAVEEADTVHFKEENANYLGALMHTDIRTDAIVMWLLCRVEPKHLLLPKLTRGLMKSRLKGRWSNTQENAWALLALGKYLKAVENEKPDFVATIQLGYKELLRQSFQGRSTQSVQASLPIDQLLEASGGKEQMVTIQKQGPGILYYRLGITYAPARLDIPAMDRGMTMERKYEVIQGPEISGQGEEVWQYKVGAYVKVTLTMRMPQPRCFLAVDDPLPAGFEHVNESFATTAKFSVGGHRFDYAEKRDDRALAFSDNLSAGTYQYIYVIRATTPGTYILPPGKVEEMYHPEVFGRTCSQVVSVVK
jgi:uncharacterized protein YfaS (alpha-2-macroglobulin family)